MALIHRFSRLLSADLHAVLDRLEDPLVLLQQAQREMAAALSEQRSRLSALEQSLKRCDNNLTQNNRQLAALANELDLCLDSNNDALARSVIKRRLQLEAQCQQLEQEQQDVREQQRALAHSIDRQQVDLDTITTEAEQLARSAQYQAGAPASAAGNAAVVTEEAVELALLAERRARGGAA